MLQSFLPLFLMTFFICLFIVLMQFLWRYIDDLVGKGLGIDVISELFFYAALTMIPLALPLAILLASLMTFGNLGERFELTAMKAGGISLVRVMKPLIALMIVIAIGAFFFQNYALPIAQTKMWTLLYSMRQKSPELEIPEGVFYDQIPGFNLFVESKNRETGVLNNMMIYDMSSGFDNARIIMADSGKLAFSSDQTNLYLMLWKGELFENLRQVGINATNSPYRREQFDSKDIIIKFDANFNRMDEEGMRNQYVGKNIAELQHTIDSVNVRVDSISRIYAHEILNAPVVGVSRNKSEYVDGKMVNIPIKDITLSKPVDIDSVFHGENTGEYINCLNNAVTIAKRNRQEFEFKSFMQEEDTKTIRRHGIEMQKKFTLSMACIIFFFIGAPLGAIIRKGGLGMPLVISVFLFIFYYIIDNTGYKLARDGHWIVWQGMWLSTAILLPLGIFFTYKAVNDSAIFNRDAYLIFFRRLIGMKETRNVSMKEFVMEDFDKNTAIEKINDVAAMTTTLLDSAPARPSYKEFWQGGYNRLLIHQLTAAVDSTIEYISTSRDKRIVNRLNALPVLRSLLLYQPNAYKPLANAFLIILPLGFPIYILGKKQQAEFREDLTATREVLRQIANELVTQDNPTHNP